MKPTKEDMKLIDGCYGASDLQEILGQLFSFKINFHNLVVNNMGVVSDEKREHSARRIVELKQERKRLETLLQRMAETGEVAAVNCTVQLEIMKNQDAPSTVVPSH